MHCLLVLVCLALSVQAQLGAAPAPARSPEELHPPPPVLRMPKFIVHDPRLRIIERGKSVDELPLPAADGASPAVHSFQTPQWTDVNSMRRPGRSAPRYPPAHAAHGPRAPYPPPRPRGTIPNGRRV